LPTKGYDADAVREALDEIEDPLVEEPQAAAGVRAMGHKRRNLIERMFNKLKKWAPYCHAIRQEREYVPRLHYDSFSKNSGCLLSTKPNKLRLSWGAWMTRAPL
jgi:hypothetical protein